MARGKGLTFAAFLLALAAAVLGYCMLVPVDWDGPGLLGAAALNYSLHLLLFTALCGALALVALRRGVRLASRVLALNAALTALMALAPVFAIWRRAQELGVPLSLGSYLASAGRANLGRPEVDRSVSYGVAADGTELFLDVWRSGRPDSGPLRPAIVMVHGGAFTHGNRSMAPDWNRYLNELGYEVFDVEYRLPPPARWLDEVGDVKAALGWVAAHAPEYHVDASRITLMGVSAGANLALLAAYSAGDPRLPPSTDVPAVTVRSVVSLYGPTALGLLYRASESPDYVRPRLAAYVGGAPEQLADRYRLLSPLSHVTARAPPTLAVHGKSDRLVPVEHATLLDQALSAAGVPRELQLLPATDHGFDVNWGGFATQLARDRLKRFLERYR